MVNSMFWGKYTIIFFLKYDNSGHIMHSTPQSMSLSRVAESFSQLTNSK